MTKLLTAATAAFLLAFAGYASACQHKSMQQPVDQTAEGSTLLPDTVGS